MAKKKPTLTHGKTLKARKANRASKPSAELLPVPAQSLAAVPAGYAQLLEDLKTRIRSAQFKAALAVNRELITLYWQIGRQIIERQQREGWGANIIDRLGRDVQAAFPGIQGFSPRNIWRMRAFCLAYTNEVANLPQAVPEMDGQNLPQAVAEIPWGHNILLLEKLKDPWHRLWYARKTIENAGPSDRKRLVRQARQGDQQL